jgi:hypothetical protein
MSVKRFLLLAAPLTIGLLPPRSLAAQRVDAARSFSVAPRSLVLAPTDSDASPFQVRMTPVAPARRAAQEGESSTIGTVMRAAVGIGAGALVGGWLGYFGAQVGRSDWDKSTSEQKNSIRQGYTFAGLGLGGVLGYLVRPKPHAPSRLPQPFNIPARTGRQLLAAAELRRSIATNALEAVELGRPEWIQKQKDDEAKQAGTPRTGSVEATSLVVYVGAEKVGGLETLRDIAIPEVTELRLYDARDAKRRWGVEHRYGAIEVVPVGTTSATTSAPTPAVPDSAPSK